MTGQQYGDFTIIEMLYGYKYVNNKPRTYCRCIAANGEEYIIRADALRSGITVSTKNACRKNEPKDVTNHRFGLLTALRPTEKRSSNGNVVWECRCDCGNIIYVSVGNLLREHTRSCGCNKKSKWEVFISDYLKKINIDFEEQKRFQDCRNSKGSDMLPFDFYLQKYNKIIEYDGEHHFAPINGWGGEEKFILTKENDEIKNKYCENNHIELLRIPYTYTKDEIINSINNFIIPVTITA